MLFQLQKHKVERWVSWVALKSYSHRASAPRRPNRWKRRGLQPCQLLPAPTPLCLQQCCGALPSAPSLCPPSERKQNSSKTKPDTPTSLPQSIPLKKNKKKLIQHSSNKLADKTHVGIRICEMTSCFQPNKFNALFPWRMHVGNWPTGVTANCKDPREQTATLPSVCRTGILCSLLQFNQTSCKESTACSRHERPMQTGHFAHRPALPSPSVLPCDKDKLLPLRSR